MKSKPSSNSDGEILSAFAILIRVENFKSTSPFSIRLWVAEINSRLLKANSLGGIFFEMKTGHDCSCNNNNKGILCAALIMTYGWEISDDYPWENIIFSLISNKNFMSMLQLVHKTPNLERKI